MKVTIDIDTQTFVRFGLVLLGFVGAFFFVFYARSALVLILIAFFFALALNPPVNFLAKRLPGKSRVGATAIAYVSVIGLLAVLITLIVPPILEQTTKFIHTIPSLVDNTSAQWSWFRNVLEHYNLGGAIDSALTSLRTQVMAFFNQIATGVVGGVGVAIGGITNLVVVLILCFFMLVEGPIWMERIWSLYPDPERRDAHRATAEKMYKVVTGFVSGQIAVAAIGATASFIALFTMSLIPSLLVPSNLALPLSVIIFLTALIPMVGTTIGGIIVALILLLNSPFAALVFGVFFVVYQQIENNIISPPIQSKTVDLSVLLILISVLIGASLFGLIGGLVSIPIAGSLRILLIDYLDRRAKRQAAERKKPFASLLKFKKGSK